MNYMKQLDALRALAVFAVLYEHFLNWRLAPWLFFKKNINWGAIGVDLFFVLSGFLITGILLKKKNIIDQGLTSITATLKSFYFRRTIRIFPIYYLTLLVAFTVAVPNVRESLLWHISYGSNFYIAKEASWVRNVSHLWSLSVEEQFYLMWPWLVLLIPRTKLGAVFVLTIGSAPLFRYACGYFDLNKFYSTVMTFGCMDLFGIGALFAYFKTYDVTNNNGVRVYLNFCKTFGTALFILTLFMQCLGYKTVLLSLSRTFEGFLFGWIIYKASNGFDGVIGYILECKPLVYLGKISYGIYLYHNFMPYFAPRLFGLCKIKMPESMYALAVIYTALALFASSISWYVIEKPISIFKDRMDARLKAQRDANNLLVQNQGSIPADS